MKSVSIQISHIIDEVESAAQEAEHDRREDCAQHRRVIEKSSSEYEYR